MARINIVNADNKIESNPRRAYFKLKNTGGPRGETGAQGPAGPKGDTGAQGPAGLSASVTVGSTTTLAPGASATVTNSGDTRNAVLNFGIPTGAQGPQGVQGPKGDTGPEGAKGAKGDTGAAATVTVANTNTGAPGTNASVENVGDEHNAVLNFTIPRGDKGETGATGPQGPAGQDGKDFTPTVVTALPETGENGVLYMTEKAHTTQTATGNPITATITDEAGKMESFQLDGDTFQQTYDGRNLFNALGDHVLGGINGSTGAIAEASDVTEEISAGYIKITNTSDTSNYRGYISGKIELAPGQYRLHFDRTDSTSQYVGVFAYNSSDVFLSRLVVMDGTTETGGFTVSSGTGYIRIVFETSVKLTTVTFANIQVESGDTDTSYQPYVGGIPSPNPDYPQPVQTVTGTQTVEIVGKNKFNQADIHQQGYINDTGGITGSNYSVVYAEYYPVEPEQNYTISYNIIKAGSSIRYIGFYDSSFSFISRTEVSESSTFTFSTPANTRYLRVSFRHPTGMYATTFLTDYINNIQIEYGSTATAYAPYSNQTLPINLGSIELCKLGTYQDYIWKDGEDWKVHKTTTKAQLATNIPWSTGTFSAQKRIYIGTDYIFGRGKSIVTPTDNARKAVALLSHFTLVTLNDILNQTADGFGISSSSYMSIRVGNASAASDILDILQNNAVMAYAALQTPTDTTITDAGLIAQLEAIRTALLQNGANTIANTAAGSNLAGDMEIGYYGYTPSSQYDKWLWLDVGAAGAHYEQI
jgi:hypothetical protein